MERKGVTFAGGSRGARAEGGQAKMTMIDTDQPSNVKPDVWWAFVMPLQTGVQMMSVGRYGYWEQRPKVTETDTEWRVERNVTNEPIVVVSKANAITLYIATAEHAEALPRPEAPEAPSP